MKNTELVSSKRDRGEILLDCYKILLGDEYMTMIAQLAQINMKNAVIIMKSDLDVVFGKRSKKTSEEIKKELDDFFAD